MGAGTGTQAAAAEGHYIAFDDVSNWADGMADADKLAIINQVEELVEKITHDYFYAASFDITLDGNGKDRLFLGLKPDIISITSIEIWGIELDEDYYTFDKNAVYRDVEAISSVELEYALRTTTGLFPKGQNNIHIEGTYGHAVCPYNIKQACIILAEDINDPVLYTHYIQGSQSIGQESYTDNAMVLTGVREADRLLRQFISKKPVMFAI